MNREKVIEALESALGFSRESGLTYEEVAHLEALLHEVKGIPMKVYLDDCRKCPEGWLLAQTAPECIEFLKTNQVESLSLDHDLGTDPQDGMTVLDWLEEQVMTYGFRPPKHITIHTANESMKWTMKAVARRILEFAMKNVVTSDIP